VTVLGMGHGGYMAHELAFYKDLASHGQIPDLFNSHFRFAKVQIYT